MTAGDPPGREQDAAMLTNVPCRQAAVAAAIVAAAVVLIAGVALDRWAIVAGAVVGGVLYVAIACARQRSRG